MTWGIGYKAWIDKQTDNWKIFVHAGKATKKFTITPETDLGKLVTLRDFVNNVNECREEIDQLPGNAIRAIFTGGLGSALTVGGSLTELPPVIVSGLINLGYSVEEIAEFTKHFNNAKHAQKNAETLFGELGELK